nr:uncharacterized protein LOC119175460 [Rhipicephalus microplus]
MNRPCCIVGCKSSDWRQVKMRHRVPGEGSRRIEWLQRIGLPASDRRQYLRVCCRHFQLEDYERNSALTQPFGIHMRRHPLKAYALPSMFLPGEKHHTLPQGSVRECGTVLEPSASQTTTPKTVRKAPTSTVAT